MQSSSSCRSWDMTEQSSNVKGIDRYCKLCQRDLAKVKVVKGRAVAKLYKSFVGCGNFATRLPYAAVSIDNGTDATYVHLWTPFKHPGNGFLLVSRSAPWLSRQPDAEGAEQHFEKVPNFWVWKGDQSTQAPVLQPHGEVMLKKTNASNASNAHLPSFSHLLSPKQPKHSNIALHKDWS